jgi:hypothetical protein
VIRALSAELDQCDNANALTQQQREVRLSEIGHDPLRAEREEAALVWHAQAQGDAIEHTGPTSDTPASSTSRSSRQGIGVRGKAVGRPYSAPGARHRRSTRVAGTRRKSGK